MCLALPIREEKRFAHQKFQARRMIMLRRIKNRKRSTSATRTRRDKVGRSVRVEPLQDRQLMAADFGIGDLAGPLQPSSSEPALVSSATAGQSGSAASGQTQAGFRLHRGRLSITGTELNDAVKITHADDGLIRVVAVTTDDSGNEVGTRDQFYTADSIFRIAFSAGDGDDSIVNLTREAMTFYGGDGDDYARTHGPSTMFGGDGSDELRGGFTRDHLYGGDGVDKLFGGHGSDVLNGGRNDDYLYGQSGHDQLHGEHGVDRMYGGSGNDEMYGGDFRDYMYGGSGNDEMYGEGGRDKMWGGDNNDTMFGGEYNDEMWGGDGNDVMMGQAHFDVMYGGEGDDRMDGGSSMDILFGEAGRDELFGRGGVDGLYGGADRDLLDGGDDGNVDVLRGDGGDDVFVRHTHWGADDPDLFTDFSAAELDEVYKDSWGNDWGHNFPKPKV